jgi:hypothetical protein
MDSAKRNIILDEPVDSKIQSVSLDCQHDLTLGTEQEYSNGLYLQQQFRKTIKTCTDSLPRTRKPEQQHKQNITIAGSVECRHLLTNCNSLDV